MEHEQVVVSDAKFEELAVHPGFALAADGASITQDDGYTIYTYVRRRDWEKKQPPFGPEASAARERIEAARRLRYRVGPEDEMLLREHEFALLRNVTSRELETYVAAEERITAFRIEQRELLRSVGERCKAWDDEAARTEFFRHFDSSHMFEKHDNLPNWETIQEALYPDEALLLLDLGRKSTAAEITQYDVSHMASARYIDSHPEEYPNG